MKIKKKTIIIMVSIVIICGAIFIPRVFAMQHYQNVGTTAGIVTASSLNVRSGPGTNYNTVAQVKRNEYVRIFAKIGNWYVIQTNSDYIGAVSSQYIRLVYPQANNSGSNSSGTTTSSNLTSDEQEVFNLINQQRTQNGLSALKIDNELQRVAKIKAQDMVNNGYFSHNSPTYGTPFEMIKNFGISYKTAGENIAGNSSDSGAVTAWMNSEGHRANILNGSFNYTGVAVINSPKYGKIFVQMFIGK